MTFMPAARPQEAKNAINAIASAYGIEVAGFLRMDQNAVIPSGEIDLLKGVKWADTEVDTSHVQNPLDVMPSAKTMVILGKRLLDDSRDVYYQVSDDYVASVEMLALDIAAAKLAGMLGNNGYSAAEYTSYYLKAFAVLAGLGWIGKSMLFVSSEHGPRLRLRGILTDADLGEPHEILSDDHCGPCLECAKACPAGAINEAEIDRKKCGACPLNHRKISARAYGYCTACTAACPVGMKPVPAPDKHIPQAVSKQHITP